MVKKLRAPSPQKLEQARRVDTALAKAYPDAKCSLTYANPLQLLIATILSAQCTDARVNKVTPALFARYKDAKAFADSNIVELEALIQSTGFFRSKAKSIREACKDIAEKHGGKVPRNLEDLTALRGVGRKTANVVLGNAFATPGMVVDTHVGRISRRLGLTKNTDPVKVEHDLMQLFRAERWTRLGHEMILHGRQFCKAPTPRCSGCPLLEICPYPKKVMV
jgi:endonuclease III